MAEDRVQYHLLSSDQFIHVRLGVVVQHGRALRSRMLRWTVQKSASGKWFLLRRFK
jgi:hypothetical protein